MLTINILCIGKIKEKFFQDAIKEYSKRLSKFCKLNIIELPDQKIPNIVSDKTLSYIKSRECNNIISHIKKDSYIIALDLKGKEYTSTQLSRELDSLSLVTSNLTFIIGGSLGLTKEVLDLTNKNICFSKFTFPHQLMRIFLLEQLFRAFKISNGEIYHR